MEKVKTNIRRGDTVVIIAGKDKGKKGKVLMVFPDDNACIVEGVNIIVKHRKARTAQQKSAREKKAGKIDISNVQILCKCGKATRVGNKIIANRRVRVCVRCNEALDKKFVKLKEKAKDADGEEVKKDDKDKADKKPLQRREVKAAAESTVKKPSPSVKSQVSLPRKIGS